MANVGTLVKTNNVYKKPLHLHSTSPMTGYKRNGFCDVSNEDTGNHSIAATVTDEFLDFSAAHGNDLRKLVGLKGGQKWCLCASRWKEAFEARSGDKDPKVPKVHLHASHEAALNAVSLKDLKMFAAEAEASNSSDTAQTPGNRAGLMVKEHDEISGHTGGARAADAVEAPLVSGSRGFN